VWLDFLDSILQYKRPGPKVIMYPHRRFAIWPIRLILYWENRSQPSPLQLTELPSNASLYDAYRTPVVM
jgi:hypothetical protein